nr:MAG TPA: Flagellin, PadR, transcription factor, DNA.8A [Caudoviricetes sp.]
MVLNIDCMRAVLEYLVDNLSLRYEDLTTEFRVINVNAMYTDIIGYDDEDIFYAVYNLWQAGYIEANVKMSYTIIRDFDVWNVSYEGQQFYQNIHKSSVWERTKQVANKAGSVAISILSSIAQSIIMQEIAGLIAQQ